MIDISVHELNKYYGANHVLKNISFEIYSGEKMGLLGKNGSGKTTMFKVITEEEPFESGNLTKASGKRIEILAQIPVFADDDTVEDILHSSFADVTKVYEAMKKIEGNEDPKVLNRYGRLMEEYEHLGGYDVDYKIDKICNGMNINELRESPFNRLSGGEKTRVNLARVLLKECDILLLDEPTNHLDMSSLYWLETFLKEYKGTVVVISHDRAFLDNTVTRIIEIVEGAATFYSGNYSWFVEEKRRRITSHTQQYERQQKEIKRIEDRAKWFVEQNQFTTKHHVILSRLNHMDKIDKPITYRKISEDFSSGGYAAKVVVSLEDVCKGFGENQLMSNLNLDIARNDRIALLGPNGCGKTTLIKLIMGEETCDSGTLKVSSNVKIIYMPQIIRFKDENATILETLRNEYDITEGKARSILTKFLFRATDIAKKVSSLSGGEKSRLKLCLLMQETANFLIMDEPTNHLDIDSREWIEDAVADWDGTMLFISHDRYFLDKFATKIWSMQDREIAVFDNSVQE
ncbi:MAG: ATP-binding cassette domain-containing protein [Oscillospiraceae bacterium]|nr:ATP-binding cassette domain-containing protein [Oscillospiraceae bacterium]